MNFWETASTESKLAQIDGAIECLMTTRQCAMNLQVEPHKVIYFANDHGRHFARDPEALRRRFAEIRQTGALKRLKQKSEYFGSDPSISSLAKIFPDDDRRENLFDPHPYEDEVA